MIKEGIKYLILAFVVVSFSSCKDDSKNVNDVDIDVVDTLANDHELDLDTSKIKSEYDLTNVDKKNLKEFKESLEKIEKEHGIQWDFCTCIIKNDSIDKAFKNPDLSDAEFDRLAERFDVIEQHCKAFLAQDANQTPEDRAEHEERVRKCLKNAGIK